MEDNSPSFVKYPKIPHLASCSEVLNFPVQIFEKMDGGNAHIRISQGRILAANRSKFLTDKDKKFPWFNDFLRWAKRNYSFYDLPENLIVFGEWLAPHTLEYDQENINKFYVLDLFDLETGKFFPYTKGKNLLKKVGVKGLEFLSSLFHGKIKIRDLELLTKNSKYKKGFSEGVVVKDYPNQRFAKLWTSSIKRDSPLVFSDLVRVYFSMEEAGATISKLDLSKELHNDLTESGFNLPFEEVKEYVSQNYADLTSRHL